MADSIDNLMESEEILKKIGSIYDDLTIPINPVAHTSISVEPPINDKIFKYGLREGYTQIKTLIDLVFPSLDSKLSNVKVIIIKDGKNPRLDEKTPQEKLEEVYSSLIIETENLEKELISMPINKNKKDAVLAYFLPHNMRVNQKNQLRREYSAIFESGVFTAYNSYRSQFLQEFPDLAKRPIVAIITVKKDDG